MEIRLHKTVTLVIAATGQPALGLTINKPPLSRRQTATVRHHDTATDILDENGINTDGTQVILRPGTNEPFDYDDIVYGEVESNMEVYVVPNREGQVGGDAVKAPAAPSKEATAPTRVPAPPVSPFVKLLRNPMSRPGAGGNYTVRQPDGSFTQPDTLVHNLFEESAARQAGFTIEVPAP